MERASSSRSPFGPLWIGLKLVLARAFGDVGGMLGAAPDQGQTLATVEFRARPVADLAETEGGIG
jgi:hypothetical protein